MDCCPSLLPRYLPGTGNRYLSTLTKPYTSVCVWGGLSYNQIPIRLDRKERPAQPASFKHPLPQERLLLVSGFRLGAGNLGAHLASISLGRGPFPARVCQTRRASVMEAAAAARASSITAKALPSWTSYSQPPPPPPRSCWKSRALHAAKRRRRGAERTALLQPRLAAT